jgi:bifunctional DNA-binding transcriptional regulator/antitoxin component of YhaV-PrlF toxin-antitoxin module
VAKVTSKLQITVPKALALQHGIRPGDEIEWSSAGSALRVAPVQARPAASVAERLKLFDEATARQRRRQGRTRRRTSRKRGWTREGLYGRGLPG